MVAEERRMLVRWVLIASSAALAALVAFLFTQFHYLPHFRFEESLVLSRHGFEPAVRSLPPPGDAGFTRAVKTLELDTRVPGSWTWKVKRGRHTIEGRHFGSYALILIAPYRGRAARISLYFNGFSPQKWASKNRLLLSPTAYRRYFRDYSTFRRNFKSDLAMWMAIVGNRNSEDSPWGFGTQWEVKTTCLLEKAINTRFQHPYVYRNRRGQTLLITSSEGPAGRYVAGGCLGWFNREGRLMAGWAPGIFRVSGVTRKAAMKLLAIFFARATLNMPPRGWVFGAQ